MNRRFLLTIALLAFTHSALAQLVVTTAIDELDDPGVGLSLREAIRDSADGDTITFDQSLAGETIFLSGGELLIDKSLTIDAAGIAGGITIDGNGNGDFVQDAGETRCLFIFNDELSLEVVLTNLTIQNGSFEGEDAGANIHNDSEAVILNDCQILGGRSFGGFGDADGGGIYNTRGSLMLDGCTVSNNRTSGSDANGGGIFSINSELTIVSSTLTGNGTDGGTSSGGGIYSFNQDLTLTGCTFANNSTAGDNADGGCIFSDTNVSGTQTTRVTNCTFHGNTAGNARGGALYNRDGRAEFLHCTFTANFALQDRGSGIGSNGDDRTETVLTACIVAGNTNSDVDFDSRDDTNSFISGGYNLIGTGSAVDVFIEDGDLTGIADPMLSSLGDNGGPTQTVLLLPGSPAIDAALTALETDQRLFSRPVDGNGDGTATSDIGATELQAGDNLSQIFDVDGDNDGNSFGIEFTLGTDPDIPDAGDPANLRVSINADGDPVLTFGYNPDAVGIAEWIVERSTDLATWQIVSISPDPGGATTFTDVSAAIDSGTRFYYRFRARLITD